MGFPSDSRCIRLRRFVLIAAIQIVLAAHLGGRCNAMGTKERTLTDEDKNSIIALIETLMQCRNIPGLTLSVVNKTHALLEKGFGYSSIREKAKATEDTLFAIGSTTKAFTSTLLAKLIHSHNYRYGVNY